MRSMRNQGSPSVNLTTNLDLSETAAERLNGQFTKYRNESSGSQAMKRINRNMNLSSVPRQPNHEDEIHSFISPERVEGNIVYLDS